jgi:Beta-lactamase enzyme family
MTCYPMRFECFEAFAPVELASLYADLYQGKVLNEQDTRQWLSLMKKDARNVALIRDLTPAQQASLTPYIKDGFSAKNGAYPVNFQHEAGIVVTPYGVFTLAVFSQGNPDWPGIEPLGAVGKIVYDYFVKMHGGT